MTIEEKIKVLEICRKDGATEEQIERFCRAMWPLGVPEEVTAAVSKEKPDITKIVSSTLHELGIPASILGYQYLKRAIIICINDDSMLHLITKRLYTEIAKEFDTTPTRVERAIRHAIEVAWYRGDVEVFEDVFGNTVSPERGRPTNGEFISMVVEYLKLQYNL